MTRRLDTLVIAALLAFASSADASPPPPPPSFVADLAEAIVPTQTAAGFDRYAAALADDLVVIVNGTTVAAGKTAWLALERGRLGKVDRRVLGSVEGRDSVLVLDRYDDRSALPTRPGLLFDPRYRIRASRYEIGPDQLVHVIRIVETEGVLRPAQ